VRAPPTCQNPAGQCSNHSPSLYPVSSQLTRETGGGGVLTARRVMMQHEQSFSESKRLCRLARLAEGRRRIRARIGSLGRTRICVVGVTEAKIAAGGLASLDQPFSVLHQPQTVWVLKLPSIREVTGLVRRDRGRFSPAAAAIA
jgi:hypothetical protein